LETATLFQISTGNLEPARATRPILLGEIKFGEAVFLAYVIPAINNSHTPETGFSDFERQWQRRSEGRLAQAFAAL